MQLTSLVTRDDAVSPVIGVILMVAITVILAAVIGTFVLGLGTGVASTSPSANFGFDYQSGGAGTCSGLDDGGGNAVDITHTSGDGIPADQLVITDGSSSENWYDCDGGAASTHDISAGNTASVGIDADDTVRVLWESGDDSATLSIWDGPDA